MVPQSATPHPDPPPHGGREKQAPCGWIMSNLPLTLACWDYDRTRPLFDGRVTAPGIDLDVKGMRPREIFPRMLERHEFHPADRPLDSYFGLLPRGRGPFGALPIALSKIFRHSCIYV